jgi:starvation-inducible DNA-binding protein
MTSKTRSTPQSSEPTTVSFRVSPERVEEIGIALRSLLADFFTLYLKTKNFHWHMRGIHFRDFHLLLDEQGDQLFEATDAIAERARKIGAASLRSIGDITLHQRLSDNNVESVAPLVMLSELCSDNLRLASFMRETHGICDQARDLATASLLENWIDEAERRAWFLGATTIADS